MAKGGKKGPPYPANDDAKYIVVLNGYGMPSHGQIQEVHIIRLSGWLSVVYGMKCVVDSVYTMKTVGDLHLSAHPDYDYLRDWPEEGGNCTVTG
jgi:hypothetical protein